MIIGCMRVKNEARWIRRSINSIRPLCHSIIVLDDHSTDGTDELAFRAGARVWPSPFVGAIDEARDKNYLIEIIKRKHPDASWVLMIDGDEELAPGELTITNAPAYTFRVAYLWDEEDQERVDGVYANLTRPSLFNLTMTNGIFRNTGNGGNFHCFNVPSDLLGRSAPSGMTLLHYGYLHREDRIRKYDWYNETDPNNDAEDRYRHMVIGDLLPSETVTKHAGPLKLKTLEAYQING